MKKFLSTFFLASMMLSAYAGLGLTFVTVDENEEDIETTITKDTTIIVTNYEEDWDGNPEMTAKGKVSSTSNKITITIERSAEGLNDQFCLGSCLQGNGEKTQVEELTLGPVNNIWFAHFYPTEPSETTIAYTFNDGVNPAITLTIQYNYAMTAVENVVAPQYNGKIYNLLGQEMPSKNLSELPKGIYIINGKKFIHQ
jgi:hypothetical protein